MRTLPLLAAALALGLAGWLCLPERPGPGAAAAAPPPAPSEEARPPILRAVGRPRPPRPAVATPAGEARDTADAKPSPGGPLRLHVVDDEGRPLEGAGVDFWLEPTSMGGRSAKRRRPGVEPVARTNVNGSVSVPSWYRASKYGRYRVQVAGYELVGGTLPPASEERTCRIQLTRLGDAAGTVFDPSGRPWPGATVTLHHVGGGSKKTVTDDEGRWTLSAWPGRVQLEVSVPGGIVASTKGSLAKGRRFLWDAHVAPQRVIAGTLHAPDLEPGTRCVISLHAGGTAGRELAKDTRKARSGGLQHGDRFRFAAPRGEQAWMLTLHTGSHGFPALTLGPQRGAPDDVIVRLPGRDRSRGRLSAKLGRGVKGLLWVTLEGAHGYEWRQPTRGQGETPLEFHGLPPFEAYRLEVTGAPEWSYAGPTEPKQSPIILVAKHGIRVAAGQHVDLGILEPTK